MDRIITKSVRHYNCDGCCGLFQKADVKRLEHSNCRDMLCPRCYTEQSNIKQVEDMGKKELEKLLSEEPWETGYFSRISRALHEINFNHKLKP